jgi:murein DD-endopeptidase MepM/ murein hydrolase activator NlpD
MIGLAISMSATGLLFPSHDKPAMAAEAVLSEPSLKSVTAATPAELTTPQSQGTTQPAVTTVTVASPSLSHEVKPGESLWELSKEYKVAPSAIAASNKITPQAGLIVGQMLNIPTEITTTPLNQSRDNLKASRQRLQTSLSALRSEKSKLKSEIALVQTEVSDASREQQSLNPEQPTLTALTQNGTESNSIEIPVAPPETDNRISINTEQAVTGTVSAPTPVQEVQGQTLGNLKNSPINATSFPQVTGSPTPNRQFGEPRTPYQPQSVSKLDTTLNNNQPIPIPVTPAEEPTVTKNTEQAINLVRPQAIPTEQPGNSVVSPVAVPQSLEGQAPSRKSYQIKPGDTLNSIARRHGVSVSELIKANGLTNSNLIKVNQSLLIPEKRNKIASNSMTRPNLPPLAKRNSSLPAQLPPYLTGVRDLPSNTPTSGAEQNQSSQSIEIAVDSPTDAYRNKLRSEMAGLQQAYPNQPSNNPQAIPLPVESPVVAVAPESVNPEWSKQSQELNNRPSLLSSDTSSRFSRTEPKPVSSEGQLVGAAPIPVEEYNESFQIPVGQTVEPNLPGLSNPEHYLPDSLPQFNGYIWPAKGVLTSGFGRRWGRMHKGIDIAAPIGTPVFSAAAGEVISAGWNSGGYGNLVKVRHTDGSITFYAHNSRIMVRAGQIVQQGELISEMGSTGFSTGPHLHFEVHPTGKGAVNPIAYLPAKSRS